MKIRNIIEQKLNEILKSKIKLISICTIFVIFVAVIFYSLKFTYAIPENNDNNNYNS